MAIFKKKLVQLNSILSHPILPHLIFTLCFLIVYSPNFLYSDVPFLLNDSFLYLNQAFDMVEGDLPLNGYNHDFPYGIALFSYLIISLGGSFFTVVIVQTIIFFLSCQLIIFSIRKISVFSGIWSSVILVLFVSNPQSLLYNSLIYSESLYMSILMLLTSFVLLKMTNQNSRFISIGLGFIIPLSLFMRTNAICLFALIPLFVLTYKKKDWTNILIGLILGLLLNSSVNFVFKGYFLPSEPNRYTSTLERKKLLIDKSEKGKPEYMFSQALKTWTSLTKNDHGNHYYYRTHKQIENFSIEKITERIKLKHINRYKDLNDSFEDLAHFIFINTSLKERKIPDQFDFNVKPRNVLTLFSYALERIQFLYRNIFVQILFYVCLIVNLLFIFKSRQRKASLQLFTIGSIHIVSLVLLSIVTVSDNAFHRYTYVSEFIIFIYLILFFEKAIKFILNENRIR